jgi:DNA repair protein RadC
LKYIRMIRKYNYEENDNRLTDAAKTAFLTVDISLQEHVIISDNGYRSYRKNGYFDID